MSRVRIPFPAPAKKALILLMYQRFRAFFFLKISQRVCKKTAKMQVKKQVVSSGNSGIISVEQPYLKNGTEEIPPMDRDNFLKIKNNLQNRGISVIQDEDGDAFLVAMNAEAMTLSDGSAVIFKSGKIPSASAAFEEIIHTTQIKNNGALNDYGTESATKEYLRREIEANEKVLKYAKAYGLTDKDVESTSRNLKNIIVNGTR